MESFVAENVSNFASWLSYDNYLSVTGSISTNSGNTVPVFDCQDQESLFLYDVEFTNVDKYFVDGMQCPVQWNGFMFDANHPFPQNFESAHAATIFISILAVVCAICIILTWVGAIFAYIKATRPSYNQIY